MTKPNLRNAITADETLEIEAAPAPTDAQIQTITRTAREIVKTENAIAKITEELERENARLKQLRESTLPEAMRTAGVETFQLTGGWTIEKKNLLSATIPKGTREGAVDFRPLAFQRLEDQGASSLIKHTITIVFGKDEDNWAKKFLRDMAQRKRPLNATREDSVHSGTLSSYCRERRDQGLLDAEDRRLFGVYEVEAAFVKPPKAQAKAGEL